MLANPIHPEKGSLAYAKAQVNEVLSFRKFVQHIADHGGYTRGKVKGVLSDMCTCLVEMLLEGKKVQLDELGDFWISLSSDGAESCEKFTASNIKAVNIVFTPGVDFENLLSKAEFETVASRSAQSATLKAEKTGKGSVDLESALTLHLACKILYPKRLRISKAFGQSFLWIFIPPLTVTKPKTSSPYIGLQHFDN